MDGMEEEYIIQRTSTKKVAVNLHGIQRNKKWKYKN